VTSAGNPMTMNLSQRYKVTGIGAEKTINSKVEIWTTDDKERITKVKDNWDGEPPPSGPLRDAFRRFNAVAVPYVISKDE